MIAEAKSRKNFFAGRVGDIVPEQYYTLYIGGGTPSVLEPELLSCIINNIKELYEIKNFGEFTVEVNPDDITPEYALRLAKTGAGRISMGVQSFIDRDLEWMGRRHNSAKAIEAYGILREAGFRNISLDLIFGYSLLGTAQWRENLNRVVELAPEHISAYQMSIDKGSALYRMNEKGLYEMPSQERCREQYELLQEVLSAAGYEQYEISNFARPGFESLHNSSYWNGTPYLGLGPGAHSYSGELKDERGRVFARRSWNKNNLTKYITVFGEDVAKEKKIAEEELLSTKEMFDEKIMLGLRRVVGVDLKDLDRTFLQSVTPEIERLKREGMIEGDGSIIRIPKRNLFISDSIIRALFV